MEPVRREVQVATSFTLGRDRRGRVPVILPGNFPALQTQYVMNTSYREDMSAPGPPQHAPDPELLRRVAQGHADAFAELFRRRRREVFRFAVHMTGSVPTGEDIVQDVFMVVMREAGRYDASRASVPAWLCGIARNCVRQRLASERRFLPLEDGGASGPEVKNDGRESPLDSLMRDERTGHLRRVIQALPLAYREALVLCDLQELSYEEAASSLGCPLGTVRSRLHRARALVSARLRAEAAGLANDEVPREAEPARVVSKGCFA